MNNESNYVNPLLCDPETGICEMPQQNSSLKLTKEKPVRILYFTDPICSSCWGIEPQLRKLKMEYGDYFEIEYKMGGLLPGWDIYCSGGISKPSDVAHHWEEVGAYYDMPIDGDLWLEDPLPSSYPPSIAFKAAQLQDEEKAGNFLRRIKEMIFMEKKNIVKWEHLQQAALEAGLDATQLRSDFESKGKEEFEEDLNLARQLGVRGFPTLFFTDEEGNRFTVYGFKPYEQFESALLKLYPQAEKKDIDTSYETIFNQFPTLTTKEFATLVQKEKAGAEAFLNDLHQQKIIEKYVSKNGMLWKRL